MARFQPAATWAAYEAQRDLLRPWLADLPQQAWSQPSALEGWSVLQLAVHVANVPAFTARVIAGGPSIEKPITLADYTAAWPASAAAIADIAVRDADGLTSEEVLALWDDGSASLTGVAAGLADDLVVRTQRGPLRIGDFLASRVNELVVHAGDLSRSLPLLEPVPVDRAALAVSCRMLAGILADRHPGHAVEVRVPPFAAVQCVEGPRHTRGTPANVVETDPATWVLIAAGRMPYAEAVAAGKVAASGQRADLGPYLPLF
ncbi:MAG: hypothetical protein QOF82_2369 [Frankiales bacterium]|nr:hypothetical protein [Frankiales bacterium]